MLFYEGEICPKDAKRMADYAGPDQQQSELVLHLLSRPVCPKNVGSLRYFMVGLDVKFFSRHSFKMAEKLS